MKTWMATLVATLGLCAATARAQEQLKIMPAPVVPETVLPAPTEAPACASSCGEKCYSSWHQAPCGRFLGWLAFRPVPSGTNLVCVGPRPPKPYQFFLHAPCMEGCGPACAKQPCASCAGGEVAGSGWGGLRFWR